MRRLKQVVDSAQIPRRLRIQIALQTIQDFLRGGEVTGRQDGENSILCRGKAEHFAVSGHVFNARSGTGVRCIDETFMHTHRETIGHADSFL
jgi:hypothetical protein